MTKNFLDKATTKRRKMNIRSKYIGNFIPEKSKIYKCNVYPISAPGEKIGTIICNGDYEINALLIMYEIQKGDLK